MSTGISNEALLDLAKTTLTNLPMNDFEVALRFQEYHVVNQWFQKDKVQEESGTSIERNIVLDTTGNAKHVRLYQKTPINVGDVHVKITAPWVQIQTHWSMDRREMLRNRAPARYIDLLRTRRIDATVDKADLLEVRAFASPNSATDDLNPRGLPYWLSKADSGVTSVGDFIGKTVRYGDGTTSTTKGGIDGGDASKARWRNWAATYDTINGEFVKRMRRAFHATQFKSPMIAKELKEGPASKYRIYMGLDEITEYEDLATKQNDNNGADLDPYHGNTSFRKVPILYTPQLDADTDDPIYAVNHGCFYPIILSGDWMREDGPHTDVEQHNVFTTFLEGSYQFFCKNVRLGGFVLSKKTSV